jgi:hypothetical protein
MIPGWVTKVEQTVWVSNANQRITRVVIAQSMWRWATGWTIGVLGFDSRHELGIFLQATASRTDLVPTQPPIQWVTGTLSLGVKQPGREADHSPPSSAEVREWVELYLHSPIRLHGVVLFKAQGHLYLLPLPLCYVMLSYPILLPTPQAAGLPLVGYPTYCKGCLLHP